ncbi:universal stress protein [Altericroceibacterium xinjiangense]|uniref:universal stress protein n=1 Tax=Altericroceibacterium xinjiangense TaxID=762261 RepID=UPI000F7E998E|nr:universal stress protein [Altericroceibacterium xinjiangense]
MAREIVLAATDLSARSDRAIDRALQLGAELGLAVGVIHVADPKADPEQSSGRLRDAVRAALPSPEAEAEIIIAAGSAPRTIAEVGRDRDAAMIVTGVARFNSPGDYLLGTAVEHIVRHSRAPVLIAKHRPHRRYETILCAVDFSDHSGNALRTALQLFPRCKVLALHAYHVPFESWQRDAYVREETESAAHTQFRAFIDRQPLSDQERSRLDIRLAFGDVGPVLRDEIAREGSDLVVFGTQGMGGLRQATIGSTAASLLEGVTPDTMIVPPE